MLRDNNHDCCCSSNGTERQAMMSKTEEILTKTGKILTRREMFVVEERTERVEGHHQMQHQIKMRITSWMHHFLVFVDPKTTFPSERHWKFLSLMREVLYFRREMSFPSLMPS